MKRRRVPPLLALQEPATYVMDSSAWFNVDERSDSSSAWMIILALIEQQRLVDPGEVVEELKLDNDLWSRLQPVESQLRFIRSDEAYLLLAGRIAAEHPALAGIRSRKTRADPFVIALAEIERFTVVTDESSKRPNRKIPGVCEKRNVPCISLSRMLDNESVRE